MKKSLLLFFTCAAIQFLTAQNVTSHIHIDQFGYLTDAKKVAVISDPVSGYNSADSYTAGNTFQVIDESSNQSVYSASPALWNNGNEHTGSGDKGWWFDFSSVTTPGTYHILDVNNNTKSYSFEIGDEVYYEVLKSATKMFYYNRCNEPKAAPYAASNWTDGDNFNHALQDSFCRFINDPSNAALERELSGGWFDAGDYNKYVTFASKPIHTLLYAYEESPPVFGDNWNIPESGNAIPDIIDEIKWELDWLQKMINTDGSVIIKMGSNSHNTNASSPPSANYDQRFYGPTCTSASIATAGMLAHAALVYQDFSTFSVYADSLEEKAKDCFDYALPFLNSNQLQTNCDDLSIVAGDADWNAAQQKQKAVLAALYLWELTGESVYENYIVNNLNDISFIQNDWLGNEDVIVLEALLHYSTLSGANQGVITEFQTSITPHVTQDWNSFFGMNDLDLYRAFMADWTYHWGSNLPKADIAIVNRLLANYNFNPPSNISYLEKASQHVHYFHGVNPQNMVYLSNMYGLGGDNCANEIYHLWFADGTDYDHALNSNYGPAPGYVVGGPNKDFTVSNISPPYGQPRQKAYKDWNTSFPENSWEITEPAIYYQAAYIRLLAAYTNDICSSVKKIYVDHTATGQDDGRSWTNAYNQLEAVSEDVCEASIDTILIATGTYTPNSTDRTASYEFIHDVVIIGGYQNGGLSYDPDNNEVILSGNIGNQSSNSDNLYHVINLPNENANISMKNLTISHGYADGSGNFGLGAAIYSASNLTLENVKISENTGANNSEGIFLSPASMLTINDIVELIGNIKL